MVLLLSRTELRTAFRFALRELRGGVRGFYIFFGCLALGVAAISGVNAVALSIGSSLVDEGRELLGGDVSFTTIHRRLTSDERDYLSGFGTLTEAATMRTIARLPDGSNQALIELKAVDEAWPNLGVLESSPPESFSSVRSGSISAGILVDSILLDRLGVSVGDELSIGTLTLTIHGTIISEPDRISDGFAFGPRVIMSASTLERTGLIKPGTLVNWTARLLFSSPLDPESFVESTNAKFTESGWQTRTRGNVAPALSENVNRFAQFLALVSLTALIVGGVGVANAVRSFLDTKRHVIACLKSLGGRGSFVFFTYLTQVLILAFIGILAGLILGSLMPLVARFLLSDILPVGGIYFGAWSLFSAFIFGTLTSLAFTLWPLGQSRDIPATELFRNENRASRFPRPTYILCTFLVFVLLVSFAIFASASKWIATIFVTGVCFSFILLYGTSYIIGWLARSAPLVGSAPLRLAIGNIHRPGALTPSVILSLGLGLSLLVALALVDGNLRNRISSDLPSRAPDFFFLDIQTSELDSLLTSLREIDSSSEIDTVPMLRGRIISINDIPSSEIEVAEGSDWILNEDRGITYSTSPPENSVILDGSWWGSDYSGEPLVSFAAEEAGELGVVVGDKIRVNVLGREIDARVANLRRVEWESLSINFVMIFSPNSFVGAPHGHLATFRTSASSSTDGEILRRVSSLFPTITIIRVRDVIDLVNNLAGQLAGAVRSAALIALLSSVLVLGGALASGNRSRTYDSVILKTLGATRPLIIRSFIYEYFILGFSSAVFGLLSGTLASWFVITRIMEFDFVFLPSVAFLTVLVSLFCTITFGLLGTWRLLGSKPSVILREL